MAILTESHRACRSISKQCVFHLALFMLSLLTILICSLMHPKAMTQSIYEESCDQDSGNLTPGSKLFLFCYNNSSLRLCRTVQSASPIMHYRQNKYYWSFLYKEILCKNHDSIAENQQLGHCLILVCHWRSFPRRLHILNWQLLGQQIRMPYLNLLD